ncbi:MAG: Colicin production protein [Planctomycetaceae bacterium]|nr:Colicin production protein [Planctomycetaceae bacterium]
MMAFDIFICVILLFTTIRGAAKGVAWQLAGIGALVLCFLFATPLSLSLAPMIKLAPPLNRWVAMLGIYLVFSFGTFAIARGFREALEKAKFVEFDRHMGALFGLFKGAIIALVITFFSVAMSQQAREYILKTYTGYTAAHIMNALDPVMPKELHAVLEPYIHELDAVDPELERDREAYHDDLGVDPNADPLTNPRNSGGGYRPATGDSTDGLPRDPFQADAGQEGPPLNDPNAPPTAAPTFMEEAEQLLKRIPSLASKVAPAVKQQVVKAMQNTLSEHRDELVDQLRQAPTPEHVSSVARAWQNGRPTRQPPIDQAGDEEAPFDGFNNRPINNNRPIAGRPQPQIPGRGRINSPERIVDDENLQPQRQELLQGIARVFSSQPSQQARKMTEIETVMLGLPDPIAVGALSDWLSDLRGEDPDPDPQTDVSTLLNVRIARQIESQNIPRNRLPIEWQTRLERYLRN